MEQQLWAVQHTFCQLRGNLAGASFAGWQAYPDHNFRFSMWLWKGALAFEGPYKSNRAPAITLPAVGASFLW